MPGCSGEPVVTTSCAFSLCTRDCGCSAHPAFPAPSLLEGGCWHRSGVFTSRERGGVCDHARRHSAHCNRIAGLHPSPICGEGGRQRAGRVGGCRRAHPHIAPTPAYASLWPTLPTKGGGIRKLEWAISWPARPSRRPLRRAPPAITSKPLRRDEVVTCGMKPDPPRDEAHRAVSNHVARLLFEK